MALQIRLKDLVGEMGGRESTNGYDVLVAYSEAKVNALFQDIARSQDGRSSKTIQFEHGGRDRHGEYKRIVHLELKEPALKFEHGNKSEVHLMFDVASGYTQYTDSTKKEDLPKGLIIDLSAALHNVSGKVDTKGQFAATTTDGHPVDSQPPGHDSALEASDYAARAICINMKSVKVSVEVASGADEALQEAAQYLRSVATCIANEFQKSGSANYYLAGVSKTYTPELGAHVLRPKAFNFSICTGTGGEPALCMWISVVDGLNNGSDNVGFQPGQKPRSPIPTGSTASVIIHHQLLWKLFFKPNLEHLENFKAEQVKSEDPIAYKARCLLDLPDYYQPRELYHGLHPYFHQRQRDAIKFSTKPQQGDNSQNATMTVRRGIQTAGADAAAIEYKSLEQTVAWNETIDTRESTSGTAYITFTWGIRGRWTNTTTGTNKGHPNMIGMEWEADKKWSMTGTAKAKTSTGFSGGPWGAFVAFAGKTTSTIIPPDLFRIPDSVKLPEVKMGTWGSLDYFLTTNLICPGKHMFMAHPITYSLEKGLALPNDLIITGDIASSS